MIRHAILDKQRVKLINSDEIRKLNRVIEEKIICKNIQEIVCLEFGPSEVDKYIQIWRLLGGISRFATTRVLYNSLPSDKSILFADDLLDAIEYVSIQTASLILEEGLNDKTIWLLAILDYSCIDIERPAGFYQNLLEGYDDIDRLYDIYKRYVKEYVDTIPEYLKQIS